jgi:alpha-beta hydrolase superfamily lysophospholipase
VIRAVIAAVVLLAASTGTAAAAETVALRAADGTALSAVWYPPSQTAPAVLLVHMLSRSHQEWDQGAQAISSAGFAVLSLDLRGHGASSGTYAPGLGSMQQDVQAALDWLKARPEVSSGRIGIAGASLGASLAVIVAANDAAVRSVVLLSPAGEYRGVRCEPSMRRFAERGGAAMLVASSGDPYALRTARQFSSMGSGPRDLRVVEGTGAHGTRLFEASPDLLAGVVDWFRRSLL